MARDFTGGLEPTDEELMVAYQEGSEEAFAKLYRRYSGRVFGFLCRRLSDRSVADDVCQTTFLRLHRFRHRYNQSLPFSPWLFTILRNTLTDHSRKIGRLKEEALTREPSEKQDEAVELKMPSLDGLTLQQREALALRYRFDLPFDEISRRLRTTPSNIRQIISRAIRKLRKAS